MRLPTLIFISSLSSAQAAELLVPEQFDLIRVNGEERATFFQREKKIPLQLGLNSVTLRFSMLYDAAWGDGHDRISSEAFTLTLSVETETEQWAVQAPQPETRDEAKRYASAPSYQLINLDTGESRVNTAASAAKKNVKSDALQQLQFWWQQASLEERQAFLKTVLQ